MSELIELLAALIGLALDLGFMVFVGVMLVKILTAINNIPDSMSDVIHDRLRDNR